jgi:hypothetical protein
MLTLSSKNTFTLTPIRPYTRHSTAMADISQVDYDNMISAFNAFLDKNHVSTRTDTPPDAASKVIQDMKLRVNTRVPPGGTNQHRL